jgi:hypothetical protein
VSTFGHADAGKTLDKRAFLLSYARIFFAKLVSWILSSGSKHCSATGIKLETLDRKSAAQRPITFGS